MAPAGRGIRIDFDPKVSNILNMSTETTNSEIMADLEAVMASAIAGRPIDPTVAARVHARTEEVRNRLPVTNVAVELIRDARDP
jgi:hypothetical protein